ncbi:M23 family metallopeptidase [Nocardioides speluncae]|uniref:M23 family metallopeptidase n=1 Tax=Nocardioides speluncae TaxID=2670337 RepID=UPI001981F4B7|nr:M23 family metallopeptidase [Nocardioides speluncae]
MLKRLSSSLVGLAVVAAVVAAAAVIVVGAPAKEAKALFIPAFEAPVPCGEVWRTYTHSGHSDADRLDMTWRDGGTEGRPILASASGTVTAAQWDSGGGGNFVRIDHGGGWTTQYLHLQSDSVSVGQTVTRGQQIGRAGNTGASQGAHLHYDQRYNGDFRQVVFHGSPVARAWYPNATLITSHNCGGGTPPPTPGKYWVDTFQNASVYGSPTSTSATGTLYQGTNYVYCKTWGREIRNGSSYNHWWLKTDPDVGPANQWVSAYYLSRWGNDEAKDNSGNVIPDCAPPAASKYWVDTYANAPVYASATSTSQTGTLYKGTNYVFCKVWGRNITGANNTYNHWWLKTDPDVGPANQWVSAYYLSRWGNDEAKDNSGTVIPNC